MFKNDSCSKNSVLKKSKSIFFLLIIYYFFSIAVPEFGVRYKKNNIQQAWIKLIVIVKTFIMLENISISNKSFWIWKYPEKNQFSFHKNINQHCCFQHR